MKKEYMLSSLGEGAGCCVKELHLDSLMKKRLSALGLIKGTRVICLQRSFSGDPAAYLVRGAVIALREKDSSRISVVPDNIT